MKTLRVTKDMGDAVQGVRLYGDPRSPEPEIFRVMFPGGDVDVVRTTDGDYWVHVRVDSEQDLRERDEEDVRPGKIMDARLDIRGEHASDCDAEDFAHPDLYHLAVRVTRR